MQATLLHRKADGSQEQFALSGPTVVCGRSDECGLLLRSKAVSRRHCQLDITATGVTVRDLGSANGTFVNGARIEQATLAAGDRLALGPFTFVLEIDGRTAAPAGAAVPLTPLRQPPPQSPAQAAPMPQQRGPRTPGTPDGPRCPSCSRPVEPGAKICVPCGIHLTTGQPLLTAREIDEAILDNRTRNVIWPISWLIWLGIFPIYSEAGGKARPYATWALAALTIFISIWFWTLSDTQMQTHKNLLLWAGDQPPDFVWIASFYKQTNYGDGDAYLAKFRSLPDDEEIDEWTPLDLYDELADEEKCLGTFRPMQLLTHAFLHADFFHLAGNLLFLLVLGSRVNSIVGNVGMVILYPLLAVAAGWAHMTASAAGMPTPMLGASGAVMGMAGIYLILFPMHRVHMVAWIRWGLIARFRLSSKIFRWPGFMVVLLYIAFDVLYLTLGTETGTAHWAHVGGFLAGAAAALLLLVGRIVHSNGDMLSLTLGKYAWPLVGRPHTHMQRDGLWITKW